MLVAEAEAVAVAAAPRALVAFVLAAIPPVDGLVAVSARLLRMVRAAKSLMVSYR